MFEDEDDELFLRVKVDNWKTGCFISKNFTDEFEPGDDLESRYPIYQDIGGYKLLYSAINDSIIENGVLINCPSGNLYLDQKVDKTKFEYIHVLYNERWYNLMFEDVEISDDSNSFILYAKRKEYVKEEENVTTGVNKITDDYGTPIKYFDKKINQVCIKYKGFIYSEDGKLLK